MPAQTAPEALNQKARQETGVVRRLPPSGTATAERYKEISRPGRQGYFAVQRNGRWGRLHDALKRFQRQNRRDGKIGALSLIALGPAPAWELRRPARQPRPSPGRGARLQCGAFERRSGDLNPERRAKRSAAQRAPDPLYPLAKYSDVARSSSALVSAEAALHSARSKAEYCRYRPDSRPSVRFGLPRAQFPQIFRAVGLGSMWRPRTTRSKSGRSTGVHRLHVNLVADTAQEIRQPGRRLEVGRETTMLSNGSGISPYRRVR